MIIFRNLIIFGIILFFIILILCWYFLVPHYRKNQVGECVFAFWGKYNTEKECKKHENYVHNYVHNYVRNNYIKIYTYTYTYP